MVEKSSIISSMVGMFKPRLIINRSFQSRRKMWEICHSVYNVFYRIMRYDFRLQCVPGKQMVVPDLLSRALPSRKTGNPRLRDVKVLAVVMQHCLISDFKRAELVHETA